jgi:hypothetical protein
VAGLIIWGFWRWLKINQANQRILEIPAEKLQPPAVEILPHHHHEPPYLDSVIIDDGYQVTKPDDQVSKWLDDVKDQLQNSDEKDEDENHDRNI